MGESLEDLLLNLHRLSKYCQLQDVTKEQYRQELVRDAFVNYLPSIHMRLLEKNELSLDDAFTLATTLEKAQKNADVYNAASFVSISRDATASSSNQEASSDSSSTLHIMEDQDPIKQDLAAVASTDKQCFYCRYTPVM